MEFNTMRTQLLGLLRRDSTLIGKRNTGRVKAHASSGPRRTRLTVEQLEDRTLLSGPSAFGHITDGQFDVINGHQEWSDITPTFFPATRSYLYADQANLNHPPGSPPDTFMLMYDEVGLTTPLGPNQFFTVSFTTVEHENGHDRLNFYTDHIFTDGTITFLENGIVQPDANGNARVSEIGGQRGKVGFGPAPNSSTPHVIAEFQIALSANQTVLNGGYSPDPQFWSSDPPTPPPPPPKKPTRDQKAALNNAADALQQKAIALALAGSVCTAVAPGIPAKLACIAAYVVPAAADQWQAIKLRALARQDPSDPNFTVIAQPVVQTVHQQPITASQYITQQEADAVNGLLTNEEQALAIEQALSTSINRAQGAFDAGSTFWEDQQQTAVDNYERRLASLVDSVPALLSGLRSAIQGTGFQLTITPSDVSTFQSELAHNGLPPEFAQGFTQALTELGADSATQTDVVNSLIAQDPNAVAALANGSFPGMLTDPSLTSPLHGVASAFGVVHLGNGAVLPGFDSNVLPGNDDASTGAVPLGFTVNFFGHNYSSLYINNNGNVTFDSPLSAFTPFDLSSTGHVIVAPFFADVDTQVGNVVTYGTGTVNGHNAFGVTWPGVGYYATHTNKLNTFQVVLIDRSDIAAGNFDIEFNYDQIQWETGDASGGSNGLGGSSARVGFSNGTGQPGTLFRVARLGRQRGLPGQQWPDRLDTQQRQQPRTWSIHLLDTLGCPSGTCVGRLPPGQPGRDNDR
jgi:hypothetical protein